MILLTGGGCAPPPPAPVAPVSVGEVAGVAVVLAIGFSLMVESLVMKSSLMP